jgi:hypothetical protein
MRFSSRSASLTSQSQISEPTESGETRNTTASALSMRRPSRSRHGSPGRLLVEVGFEPRRDQAVAQPLGRGQVLARVGDEHLDVGNRRLGNWVWHQHQSHKLHWQDCWDTSLAIRGGRESGALPQSEAGAGMMVPHFLQVRNSSEL